MEVDQSDADGHATVATASKRVANRLLSIAENRLSLAMIELQEEREKVLRSLWFAMIFGVCLVASV